jgi:tripeptide aminopeptidase
MPDFATLSIGDKQIQLPIFVGTENEPAIDIAKLREETGYVTLDSGYKNTGATKSAITFLDGEIGRGTAKVDMKKLGAKYGYTVDGESIGTIENETFSADGMKIKINGVSQHPGFAKGKMESAIKIASEIISLLPKNQFSPESTEGMQGFVHPVAITGQVENAEIDLIIRDFTEKGLDHLEKMTKEIANKVLINYPKSNASFIISEQYRNMKVILDSHPEVVNIAKLAMEKAGLKPERRSIRGGTDGSRLSFMGLPCPNIFAGEHAFHSKQEWVSLQDMQKAVETIVNICEIWGNHNKT